MNHSIFIVILITILSQFIERIQSNSINQCKTQLDQCQTNFFDELKQYKFNDFETSYYQLCSSDGSYMRFVDCVRQIIENEPCIGQQLHRELCNKRGLKLSSYRYTWKANIVHDICYRTSELLDQGLNTPKWQCDLEHYEKTKKFNGPEVCEYWRSFRDCIAEKVQEHCGDMVANISDFMFHTHTSYFSKYTQCNLPGEPHTKCWLDLIESIPRMPHMEPIKTEPSLSTTTAEMVTEKPRIKSMPTTTLKTYFLANVADDEATRSKSIDETFQNDNDHDAFHSNLVREAKMNGDLGGDRDDQFHHNSDGDDDVGPPSHHLNQLPLENGSKCSTLINYSLMDLMIIITLLLSINYH
ncbi:hypothetical protein SSS_04158 [Sarcoptes scabiei]|uniref:Uncharacterized protein n=1 Tax=Sarcoptes scabiei TaxID=52283 RepID=A0A834RCG9_SARSC|nr:hypothetical protein SSS_04158 [Sarcoptes scabiei]